MHETDKFKKNEIMWLFKWYCVTVMPVLMISHWRHSAFRQFVCLWSYAKSLSSYKPLVEFHQIYNWGAVWDKNELITFWGQFMCSTFPTQSKVYCRRSSSLLTCRYIWSTLWSHAHQG